MCEYCLISGAICFLVGFGLGRFLNLSKKEPVVKKTEDNQYNLTIRFIND